MSSNIQWAKSGLCFWASHRPVWLDLSFLVEKIIKISSAGLALAKKKFIDMHRPGQTWWARAGLGPRARLILLRSSYTQQILTAVQINHAYKKNAPPLVQCKIHQINSLQTIVALELLKENSVDSYPWLIERKFGGHRVQSIVHQPKRRWRTRVSHEITHPTGGAAAPQRTSAPWVRTSSTCQQYGMLEALRACLDSRR